MFAPLDDEIIQANVALILANPNKFYDHKRGKLDAIAVIEVAISERLETIKHHRPVSGRRLSSWSREVVAKLRHEAGLMEEAIRRLHTLGVTTASPLAVQLRRERENPLPTMSKLPAPATESYDSNRIQRRATALLNTESLVRGVDAGKIRPELIKIAVVTKLGTGPLNLSLTVGWGHAGQGGVTMPGKGKLETRGYTAEEAASWSALAERSGDGALESKAGAGQPPTSKSGVALRLPPQSILGQSTHDVFLNNTACWRNVPERVWDYTIGGYQVIKKWLSYREFGLLGRALTPDEAREVTHMARRIAALILLQPELDKNYEAVKSASVSLPVS